MFLLNDMSNIEDYFVSSLREKENREQVDDRKGRNQRKHEW